MRYTIQTVVRLVEIVCRDIEDLDRFGLVVGVIPYDMYVFLIVFKYALQGSSNPDSIVESKPSIMLSCKKKLMWRNIY